MKNPLLLLVPSFITFAASLTSCNAESDPETTNTQSAGSFEPIINGLERPTWIGSPKDDTRYLWILEKAGKIKIYDKQEKQLLDKPFMDISSNIKISMNEQGLLGLAFAPDYSKSGRFYINLTNTHGNTEIIRFTNDLSSPLICNSETKELLLEVKQDFRNHNGGWIGFGPDNMLYIGMGDGGSGNDPKNRAQDLTSHLGKLLRIDVSSEKKYLIPKDNPFINTTNAKKEIYSYGLRNPWRCSFDSDGNLFIGDVGQNKIEEVNAVHYKKANGGNFGWRLREGSDATPDKVFGKKLRKKIIGGDKPKGNIDPVYTYAHGIKKNQGLSITGGYVYRGSVKKYQGHYFFADFVNPRIWSIKYTDGKASNFTDLTDELKPKKGTQISQIASFGEDSEGELYLINHNGAIYKLVQ